MHVGPHPCYYYFGRAVSALGIELAVSRLQKYKTFFCIEIMPTLTKHQYLKKRKRDRKIRRVPEMVNTQSKKNQSKAVNPTDQKNGRWDL